MTMLYDAVVKGPISIFLNKDLSVLLLILMYRPFISILFNLYGLNIVIH